MPAETNPVVIAVGSDDRHRFAKPVLSEVTLVAGLASTATKSSRTVAK